MAKITEHVIRKFLVELTGTELDLIRRKLNDEDDFLHDEIQILDELAETFRVGSEK